MTRMGGYGTPSAPTHRGLRPRPRLTALLPAVGRVHSSRSTHGHLSGTQPGRHALPPPADTRVSALGPHRPPACTDWVTREPVRGAEPVNISCLELAAASPAHMCVPSSLSEAPCLFV